MKFFNHEIVEFVSGAQLFLHQGLIVGNANLAGAKLVDSGKKHVADKLKRVVGTLSQFSYIQKHGAEPSGGGAHAPAIEEAFAGFYNVIDALKFAGKNLVIMAELQELRVGIFQQRNCWLRGGGVIENKSCVPSCNDEVIGVIRHVALEHFRALLVSQ